MQAPGVDSHGQPATQRQDPAGGRRPSLVVVLACGVLATLAAACSSGSSSTTTTVASAAGRAKVTAANKNLQIALTRVGCYTGPITGTIGSLTTQAIRAFQTSAGLSVDGVYGPKTETKLIAAETAGTRACSSAGVATTTTHPSVTTTTHPAATTTTRPATTTTTTQPATTTTSTTTTQ